MLIIGAYGCGNCGDDAIVQSICQQFHEWDICAANGACEDIGKLFHIRTVPCRLNEGFSLTVFISMLGDVFRIGRQVITSDVLMYGGGSLIHDLRPYNLPFMFMWHALAKLLHKRVYYFSMGVGPIETKLGKHLCKRFLKSADGLFVRDERGYQICSDLGLTKAVKTADAAFAYWVTEELPQEVANMLPEAYISVTGSQWFQSSNFWKRESMNFEDEVRLFANCIAEASKTWGLPVVFVPTVVHDRRLAADIKKYLADVDFRIAGEQGIWNCSIASRIIEKSTFLLGVRMHSIIFAARKGIPFMALIYDEKVRQLVNILGMETYSVSMEQMSVDAVSECIRRVQAERETISQQLTDKAQKLKALVEQSANQIKIEC